MPSSPQSTTASVLVPRIASGRSTLEAARVMAARLPAVPHKSAELESPLRAAHWRHWQLPSVE